MLAHFERLALLYLIVFGSKVSGFSLSNLISQVIPLKISTGKTAQDFQGWGTSLAWFGEYVGNLEGDYDGPSILRQAAQLLHLPYAAHVSSVRA